MAKSKKEESHIFISYSRKDRKLADWVARQLTAGGFKIWIDRRDIPGGVEWVEALAVAIEEAEALIVLLSPNSVQSPYVLQELEIALEHNIRILPLILRPVELPDSFAKILDRLQQIALWRRRTASIADVINSLGGLRGAAAFMPDDSTIAIRENARLIAEILRIGQEVGFSTTSLVFSGGEDWNYYIQFLAMRDSPDIYAEAVGNKNLRESLQLSKERIKALLELGWKKPNKTSSGNYWREWQAYTDRDRAAIAAFVVNTFLQIYGQLWGENILLEHIDLG